VSVARFIADQRTMHRVPHAVTCVILGVSESWFYKWVHREPTPTEVRDGGDIGQPAIGEVGDRCQTNWATTENHDFVVDFDVDLLGGPHATRDGFGQHVCSSPSAVMIRLRIVRRRRRSCSARRGPVIDGRPRSPRRSPGPRRAQRRPRHTR